MREIHPHPLLIKDLKRKNNNNERITTECLDAQMSSPLLTSPSFPPKSLDSLRQVSSYFGLCSTVLLGLLTNPTHIGPESRTFVNCKILQKNKNKTKNRQSRTACGYCTFCHTCERDANHFLFFFLCHARLWLMFMRGIDGVVIILIKINTNGINI